MNKDEGGDVCYSSKRSWSRGRGEAPSQSSCTFIRYGNTKEAVYLVSVQKEQHHQENIRLFVELLCRSLFGEAQKGL